jgi:hypothetical protein
METLIGLLTLLALIGLTILAQLAPDDSAEKPKAPGKSRIKSVRPSALPVVSAKTYTSDSKLRHVIVGASIGGAVSAIVSNLLMGRIPLGFATDYMGTVIAFFYSLK